MTATSDRLVEAVAEYKEARLALGEAEAACIEAKVRDLKESMEPGSDLSVSAADRWAEIATGPLDMERARWRARVAVLDAEVRALTAIVGGVD